ncbi:glycosyltransferase family 39 protein [Amycolatopsis sp. OK19-0408]|uniref:Glycosyltransferase family 39 protein n=1 Tax=Amycolatopsis iheyensis TaxID=2945988 RepID=A0A9X2NCZ6_9PSEU|nr:glycosyltransferase family 39 protein [Amycolatopsis iheyensis]MCR6484727.1 glycosyltransferase family 39 protein [Amycolatopsis iheyensis]
MTLATETKPATDRLEPAAPRRWGAQLAAVAAVLCGTALIAVHASLYGHWLIDDAAITFAYSRDVADGYGPVLQPGAEPVEGFSNPTWMILLALGKLVGLFDHGTLFGVNDQVLFPKALALACCLGILVLFYFGAKTLTRRPALVTFIAGATLAAIPSFVIWCFSGLENSFYALTVAALAVLVLRAVQSGDLLSHRVAAGAGVLAMLAALTRPDGIIYAGAYAITVAVFLKRDVLGRSVRAAVVSVAAFAVPYGAYLVFRWFEFGRLVPNTAVAKGQAPPTLDDLDQPGQIVAYVGWLVVAVAVACLVLLLVRPSRLRTGLIALLVPFGLAVVAFIVLEYDWMGQLRFATPVWTLGAFGGAVVVVEALAAARVRGRIVLVCLLVVGLVSSLNGLYAQGKDYRANVKTAMCLVAERDAQAVNGFADILKLPNSAQVGLIDLGGTSLGSRIRVLDLAGLGDRKIADFAPKADVAGMRDYVFTEAKPELITFIGSWKSTFEFDEDPRFARDYATIFENGATGDMTVDSRNQVTYHVRRDLVDDAKLAELQAYARKTLPPILELNKTAGLRGCAPIRPGIKAAA